MSIEKIAPITVEVKESNVNEEQLNKTFFSQDKNTAVIKINLNDCCVFVL